MRTTGIFVAVALSFAATVAPAQQSKEVVCQTQGDLWMVIQQARLQGIRETKLTQAVAKVRPNLSQAVLDTVPQIGAFVYDMRMRDLKQMDLGVAGREQCLQNWDQIKRITN